MAEKASTARVRRRIGDPPDRVSLRHDAFVIDPFDRVLIALAAIQGLVLVSDELAFDAYGVRRLW